MTCSARIPARSGRHSMRLIPLGIAMFLIGSCGGGPPSPLSATATPQPGTLTLSGTVSETAPTTSVRIAGAAVTITDGPNAGRTATSLPDGAFQLTGLQAGDFTIRVRADGYTDQLLLVSFAGDRMLSLELDPVSQIVTTTTTESLGGGGAACPGYWDDYILDDTPCRARYLLNVHHAGTLTAEARSADPEVAFSLALLDVVDGRPYGQAVDLSQPTSLSAHRQYFVVVTKYSQGGGSPPARVTSFTLTLKRPN